HAVARDAGQPGEFRGQCIEPRASRDFGRVQRQDRSSSTLRDWWMAARSRRNDGAAISSCKCSVPPYGRDPLRDSHNLYWGGYARSGGRPDSAAALCRVLLLYFAPSHLTQPDPLIGLYGDLAGWDQPL